MMRPEDWSGLAPEPATSPCQDAHPHVPHLHHIPPPPQDVYSISNVFQCPGVDPEPLAPERDRPEGPEFDWQPEALNLSAAAAYVVRGDSPTGPGSTYRYAGAVHLWCELTGLDEPAALTYALQIADAVPPVTGLVPPF